MPSDYPDFPSRRQMAEYYRLYADAFGLRPNIEFNTKVVMCRPLADESWEVEFASGEKRYLRVLSSATAITGTGVFPRTPVILPVSSCIRRITGTSRSWRKRSVLPDRKNLYVFGTQQIRYGIGPLITPAARLIAKMILLQGKMELPIGLVLRESGSKLPKTHLVDPIATFRRMKIANWILPLLLRKERRLRKRFGAPKTGPILASFDANPDVRVY